MAQAMPTCQSWPLLFEMEITPFTVMIVNNPSMKTYQEHNYEMPQPACCIDCQIYILLKEQTTDKNIQSIHCPGGIQKYTESRLQTTMAHWVGYNISIGPIQRM